VGKDAARNHLIWAMNGYSTVLFNITEPGGEFAAAVKQWPDRPSLPTRLSLMS
jgi:hypothetical protein